MRQEIFNRKTALIQIQSERQREIAVLESVLVTVDSFHVDLQRPVVGSLEKWGQELRDFAVRISRDALTGKSENDCSGNGESIVVTVTAPECETREVENFEVTESDLCPPVKIRPATGALFVEPQLPDDSQVKKKPKKDATFREAIKEKNMPADLVTSPIVTPVVVTNPRWQNPTLSIEERAVLLLEEKGAASAMLIGNAIGMEQPNLMKKVLENDDRFVSAGGFWRLRASYKEIDE